MKEYEKKQLELKIESLEKNIVKIEEDRQKINLKINSNIATKK